MHGGRATDGLDMALQARHPDIGRELCAPGLGFSSLSRRCLIHHSLSRYPGTDKQGRAQGGKCFQTAGKDGVRNRHGSARVVSVCKA